jgi:predicted nucleotidyltransferase
VTRGATDPFIDVNTVLEVNEIRQIVHPRPLDRPARAKAVAHRFQNRAFGPNLRVAIHADFRARDSRKSLGLDRSVAVAAIDPIIADVMLMAELNRLRTSDVSLGDIGRPIDLSHDPDDPGEDEDSAENTELGKGIGAGMKNLGHSGNRFDKCERAAAYHTVPDKHLRECRTRVRLWVFAPQRLNDLPGSPLSREIRKPMTRVPARNFGSRESNLIQEMIQRIVSRFRPEKIILFGSHARGKASTDSDVDLLVVTSVSGSKREKQLEIRLALQDFHIPKDIVVTTAEDFEWRKEIPGTIERQAALEGKVVYARG